MAFAKVSLPAGQWTLIGNNVTNITFSNTSQFPIYLSLTATNVAPTEDYGILYNIKEGEKDTVLTNLAQGSPSYVWARPSGGNALSIVVDQ